jgi:hypothetical protein
MDEIDFEVVKAKGKYSFKCVPKPGKGYSENVTILAKGRDTGNGYIFKLPSFSSIIQDKYICMDYSDAEYIYHMLKEYLNKCDM